jgi:hypothetical protein
MFGLSRVIFDYGFERAIIRAQEKALTRRQPNRQAAGGSEERGGMRQISLVDIKRRMVCAPGARRDLDRIVRAGADRTALIDLIARAVITSPDKSPMVRMRAKQRELRSLAMQLRTVARFAVRVASDPDSYLEFLLPARTRGFERYKAEELRQRNSLSPSEAMLRYASWADKQVRSFGKCLRKNSQMERNLGPMFLLLQVHMQTGELFAPELARLLTDASEAVRGKRTFTSGQLMKMFKRHVLPNPPTLH